MGKEQIGPYRLLRPLGQGGMSLVYEAEHQETGQRVAVKTVRVWTAHLLGSIRREIRALSRLRHPGVVRILDQGLEGGLPWYAMDLLKGHTLRHWLARLGASPREEDQRTEVQGDEGETKTLATLWWT